MKNKDEDAGGSYMKKILITGGSGFVGRNTSEFLKKYTQYQVFAPTSKELNCIDEREVRAYLEREKFDIVLNFAVYGDGIDQKKDGTKILEYNLRMFHNFARYNSLYEKMIYAGSGAEYDKRFPICSVKEEEIGQSIPVDQYGLMKYTVGQIIETTPNIYNLRLFGIFGKYEYWPVKFISNICCKAIYDLPLSVRQNVYFDYLWIEDFLNMLLKFLEIEKPEYHTYNMVSGQRIDLITLCHIVNKVSNKNLRILSGKEGYGNEYTANNDRILNELGGFEMTSMEQAVEKLYSWYLTQEIDLYRLIY